MEREEPKAMELEQELDALYRKVASVDKTAKAAPPVIELKMEAAELEEPQIRNQQVIQPPRESEEPQIRDWRDTPPPKKEEKRPRRFFRVIPVLVIFLFLCLIAFFFWPTIYYEYKTDSIGGMVYPLRVNRLTQESSYFDGTTWMRPPIPEPVKTPVPEAVKAPVSQSPNIPEAVKAPPVSQSPNIPVAPVTPPYVNQMKKQPANSQAASVSEKTPANTKYAIQIKAFPESQKKEALAFMKSHKKKGLPTVTMETVSIQGRGVWHRMLVGDFATIKDASNAIVKLKQKNAYPDLFVQRKSGE